MTVKTHTLLTLGAFLIAGFSLVGLVGAAPAVADGPVWNVRAIVAPSNLPPGGKGDVFVRATDLGDMAAQASTEPIKISVKLPPGLIGNPTAIPQCPTREFENGTESGTCPEDTAVSVVSLEVSYRQIITFKGNEGRPSGYIEPVYNLQPSVGEPARFGFRVLLGGAI